MGTPGQEDLDTEGQPAESGKESGTPTAQLVRDYLSEHHRASNQKVVDWLVHISE